MMGNIIITTTTFSRCWIPTDGNIWEIDTRQRLAAH